MNTGERVALQGLLLLVQEITNHAVTPDATPDTKLDEINELLDSAHAREHIQLARSLLDAEQASTPAAIPAAAAGIHN
jgi:hypothetical protein